jgi:hypothetical protein
MTFSPEVRQRPPTRLAPLSTQTSARWCKTFRLSLELTTPDPLFSRNPQPRSHHSQQHASANCGAFMAKWLDARWLDGTLDDPYPCSGCTVETSHHQPGHENAAAGVPLFLTCATTYSTKALLRFVCLIFDNCFLQRLLSLSLLSVFVWHRFHTRYCSIVPLSTGRELTFGKYEKLQLQRPFGCLVGVVRGGNKCTNRNTTGSGNPSRWTEKPYNFLLFNTGMLCQLIFGKRENVC